LFQIYDRNGKPRLNEPVNVSRSPTVFSWLPRVVLSPKHLNEVFILWQEIVFSGGSHGGEVFFARSRDGGASFNAPINLSNSISNIRSRVFKAPIPSNPHACLATTR
jgi:hypothetical protein